MPSSPEVLPVTELVRSFDISTIQWHRHAADLPDETTLSSLVLQLHRANFDLWHQEDEARAPHATDAQIAATKRNIDRINQRRNDTVERIDSALLEYLSPLHLPASDAPLHSETPGLILDRLSILALKRFHTAEEIERPDAPDQHRLRNQQRLQLLEEQSVDLTNCLIELWKEVQAGTKRFKLYRQLKMYNDPDLNPAIYRSGRQ